MIIEQKLVLECLKLIYIVLLNSNGKSLPNDYLSLNSLKVLLMVQDKIKEVVDSKKLRSETPTDSGSDLELERGESNMKVT